MMMKIDKRTEKLFKGIFSVLKPLKKITIAEWAEDNRVLSTESSAEAGKWRNDRAYYQVEIMNAISDEKIRKVILQCSAQVGKSEIMNNAAGYYIDREPCPMLWVTPTDQTAEAYSKERLTPMFRDTKCLKDKIFTDTEKAKGTIKVRNFAGGYLALVSSNSPSSLASRPVKVLFLDEIDRYPESAGNDGDPVKLAEKRTTTFFDSKITEVSTPVDEETSTINREFKTGTMEEFNVPCPLCNEKQTFIFKNIRFKDFKMQCKHCKKYSTEAEWKKNIAKGKWIAKNIPKNKTIRSFHINALYSPWEKWEGIVNEFLEAQEKAKDGDITLLKIFYNLFLGLPWKNKTKKTITVEKLLKRRKDYGAYLHDDIIYITAGIDTQDDRFEVEVVGYSENMESYGIEYRAIYGDPTSSETQKKLDNYLNQIFYYKDGKRNKIQLTCVDTGGNHTSDVYRYIKPREKKNIFGIKGGNIFDAAFVSKPSKSNLEEINLYTIGVSSGKQTIMNRLEIDESSPGYCHFPLDEKRGYNEQYFNSLLSEELKVTTKKGKRKLEWVKTFERNEALDCRNYANAAYVIANPNIQDFKKKLEIFNNSSNVAKKQEKTKRKTTKKEIY